jgi:hypothetical protein
MVLQLQTTVHYRSSTLLQLALYSCEEWSVDLHMRVLSERNDLGHVPNLRVLL